MVSEARTSEAGTSEAADALRRLDEILAQRPKPEQHLYSYCTERLTALRDRMIETGADRARLAHVNAIISVVMAGHFPLGAVPWEELQKARGWLSELVDAPGTA